MATLAYWIEGPWKGRLAIVPRPRGGDWLKDEVSDWREVGIDRVVSLLTPDEVTELELEAEKELCEAHGIRFVSFPIPDRGVPASQHATADLVRNLDESLEKGKTIALHCRQGIGRSALIAALLDPVRLHNSGGFSRTEINRIQKLVEENREELVRSWNDYFNG